MLEHDDLLRDRFERNRTLIDFDYIPVDLVDSILVEYDTSTTQPKSKVLNYLIEKRLTNLIDNVSDF